MHNELDPKASKIHDEFNITNPNMLNAQQVRFSKQANDKFTMATMPKQSRKVKMVPKTNKQTKTQHIIISGYKSIWYTCRSAICTHLVALISEQINSF